MGAEQADQVIAFDKAAVVVEQEATVKVAIPGDTEICAMPFYCIDGYVAPFGKQGVGDAIWKIAIGLMLNFDELEGQMLFKQVDHRPRHAVAGIDHYLEWFERVAIADITEQVVDVVRGQIGWRDTALVVCGAEGLVLGNAVNIDQATVGAERLRALANEFEPIISTGLWLAVIMMPPSSCRWNAAK